MVFFIKIISMYSFLLLILFFFNLYLSLTYKCYFSVKIDLQFFLLNIIVIILFLVYLYVIYVYLPDIMYITMLMGLSIVPYVYMHYNIKYWQEIYMSIYVYLIYLIYYLTVGLIFREAVFMRYSYFTKIILHKNYILLFLVNLIGLVLTLPLFMNIIIGWRVLKDYYYTGIYLICSAIFFLILLKNILCAFLAIYIAMHGEKRISILLGIVRIILMNMKIIILSVFTESLTFLLKVIRPDICICSNNICISVLQWYVFPYISIYGNMHLVDFITAFYELFHIFANNIEDMKYLNYSNICSTAPFLNLLIFFGYIFLKGKYKFFCLLSILYYIASLWECLRDSFILFYLSEKNKFYYKYGEEFAILFE